MASTEGTFRAHVFTLMGGTVLAQLIPLAATPILSRLYTPEQFGVLAVLFAIANPLSLLVCGRYELTVVLPSEDAEARALVRLGACLALCVSLLLGATLWMLRVPLLGWMHADVPDLVFMLAPVMIFCMGAFQPFNYWLMRRKAFRSMAVNKVAQTSAITGTALLLGWWGAQHGLLFAYTIGWAAYLAVVIVQASRQGCALLARDHVKAIEMGARYGHFPLFNALPAVLQTATLSIPVFVLTRLFDEHVTGQFNLCRQVIFVPGTFIASAIMQVYTQQASSAVAAREPLMPGLRRALRVLGAMAIAMITVLVLAGPWLFETIFGEAWREAGSFARLLAVPVALQYLATPLTVLLPAMGRIRAQSLWQVVYFSAMVGVALVVYDSPEVYLTSLAVLDTLAFTGLALYIFRVTRHHDAALSLSNG